MKNVKTLTKAELEMMKKNMDIYVSEGYTITAQRPVIGEVYHNFLENVPYCATKNDTDKVLLIGTVGEPWFADINKVLKDYANIDGTDLIISDITSEPIRIIRKTSYNAAIRLEEDVDVITSNGHVLHAKADDYLVCSTKEENGVRIPDDTWGYWTINQEVFYNTNKYTGGKCGDDIYWIVNKDGTLTIGGTGTMYDYDIIYEEWERGHDTAYSPIETKAPWLYFNIKTVVIKDGVENISDNAFYFCKNIKNVIISNTVTSIGNNSFRDCRNLVNITIPHSVISIGSSAFEDCYSLINITIPNNITIIEDSTFSGCCLTSIIIPDSVTIIGDYAFHSCNLTHITIPNSVTDIGSHAFSCCYDLISVQLSNNLTKIKSYTFERCNSLTNITIPDSIISIGGNAFEDCKSLLSVCVSNLSVWCNIDFGNSKANPLCNGGYLFVEKSFKYEIVTNLIILNELTTIKPYTFSNYRHLSKVIIGNKVTDIKRYAFYGCENLKSINIGYNVTDISNFAFVGCHNLTNIQIDDNNNYYSSMNGILFNKEQTELIIYPEGKPNKNYIIPDTIREIKSYAFNRCDNLKNITIGHGIEEIDSNTFYKCKNLTKITINKNVKFIRCDAFDDSESSIPIHIDYKGTREEWQNVKYNRTLGNETIKIYFIK